MKITVTKPSAEEIVEFRRFDTWRKEPSVFDWEYDTAERCYLLEGEVIVTTPEGESAAFGAGDMVSFPAGMKCRWEVRRTVVKHYKFD